MIFNVTYVHLMVTFSNFILSLCYKKYKYVLNGWLDYLKMLHVYTPSKEIGYKMTHCMHFKWIFID